MNKIFLKWEEINMPWENINRDGILLTWEDISIISHVGKSVQRGDTREYEEWIKNNPWKQIRKDIGEEKTERFIKIFCEINGMNFEEVRKIEENKIKLTIENFEKVFKKIEIKVNFKK